MKSKISLLVPTRHRPQLLKRFYDSAIETADDPESIEILAYITDDDLTYNALELPQLVKIRGKRKIVSDLWNQLLPHSTGQYLGLMSDDFIFRTKGWDTLVEWEINNYPDNIVFVYGDDGDPTHKGKFGTYGFIHQDWVKAIGYATPPYFSSDYWDTWLKDVAKKVRRYVYIDILVEHMHHSLGKAELDDVKKEMLANHKRDNVEQIYANHAQDRIKDADKLRKVMNG